MPIQQRGGRRHQLAAGVVEDRAKTAKVHHLGMHVGILGRFQRTPDSPDMAATLDAAKKYRVGRRLVS